MAVMKSPSGSSQNTPLYPSEPRVALPDWKVTRVIKAGPNEKKLIEVAIWNIAWKSPRTSGGKIIQEILERRGSDIICVCETHHIDLLPGMHGIFSDPDYGYPMKGGRRKVALWALTRWEHVSTDLPDAPTGRFVKGVTEIAGFGHVTVIGVCVPWEAAHVATGRNNRRRWEDHLSYLKALAAYLQSSDLNQPTILLGDFNQTLPPDRAPKAAQTLLRDIAKQFVVLDKSEPTDRTVCHIMLAGGLDGQPVFDLPDRIDETRLSDHRGQIASVHLR